MSSFNLVVKSYRVASWSALLAALVCTPASAESAAGLDARARAIHSRTLVLDSHVDVLLPSTLPRYAGPDGKSAAELTKLLRGGVGAVTLAIAVGPGARTGTGFAEARTEAADKLKAIQAFISENSDKVALARSANEITKLHAEGKIAIIESFQNTRSIGKDLTEIDRYYRAGVRLFGFTHAGNNDFADSSRPTGEPAVEHHGLSPIGKKAVAKLNRLGIIIDVSQLSTEALLQTVQLSKAPVIASHSAVRALVDAPRNLTDRELEAIRQNGGVVHVTAFNAYLVRPPEDFGAKVTALRKTFSLGPANTPDEGVLGLPGPQQAEFFKQLAALAPKATLAQYVDHIDYVVKRIGIDHVGIGSDFNHGAGIPGFQNEADALNVTRELVRRGYGEEQIGKIWSGNFLRVLRAVEAESKKEQAAR